MENLRDDFPIFDKKDIHYLDSSATTQRPRCVIDNLNEYYTTFNANAGRGSYELSMINTSIVENTRKKVKEFIGSGDNGEVVFTKNCTEAINLVAYSYGLSFLKPGDEILLCVSNHHANILPWQFVKKVTSCTIKYFYLDEYGQVDMEDFKYKVNKNTKIVALSSVVNTTGIIQPFEEIINYAHKYDALVLLDCAQSIQHFKHEVFKWDVDFMTFSGHKVYSSFGVGVLYAKKDLLEKMPPFIYGGDMIEYVEEQYSTYAKVPTKFEGGTLDSAAIYSLSRAIDYINLIGFKKIEDIENKLLVELLFKLKTLDFVETYYTENVDRVPVVAFNVKGVHSHDTAFILDKYKVSVRSGQHCTAPLHQFMKINSTCRASLNVYNTSSDIDALIKGLEKVKEVFKL